MIIVKPCPTCGTERHYVVCNWCGQEVFAKYRAEYSSHSVINPGWIEKDKATHYCSPKCQKEAVGE